MRERRVFCSCEFLLLSLFDEIKSDLIQKLWYSPVEFHIDENNSDKINIDEHKELIQQLYEQKAKLAADDYLAQIDFRKDNKALLAEESIYNFYNDIFIIDEDEDYCEIMCQKFGILIISEKSLKNLDLIFSGIDCVIDDPNTCYPSTESSLPGWDCALTREAALPRNQFIPIAVNAILICDLYVLAYEPDIGIENIKSLINFFIKNNPTAQVDVTLFTMICKPKTSKDLFSIDKAKECVRVINDHFENVTFDIFLHQEKTDFHGRIVVTNFYYGRDPEDKGFKLFNGSNVHVDNFGHKLKGELEINGAFKYKINNEYKGALHKIESRTKTCSNLKNFIHRVLDESKSKNVNFVGYLNYIPPTKIRKNTNKYNRLLMV